MTERNKLRAQCIEAMLTAYDRTRSSKAGAHKRSMIAAFDALHRIVRVVPPVATEEMNDIGDCTSQDYPEGGGIAVIFNRMARFGDLTNPPEAT